MRCTVDGKSLLRESWEGMRKDWMDCAYCKPIATFDIDQRGNPNDNSNSRAASGIDRWSDSQRGTAVIGNA